MRRVRTAVRPEPWMRSTTAMAAGVHRDHRCRHAPRTKLAARRTNLYAGVRRRLLQYRSVVRVPIGSPSFTRRGCDLPLLTGIGQIVMSNHPRFRAAIDTARVRAMVVPNPWPEGDGPTTVDHQTCDAVRGRLPAFAGENVAPAGNQRGDNSIPGSSYAPTANAGAVDRLENRPRGSACGTADGR